MKRDELGELAAFLAVAEERSFTRAAAKLGTSQSSLSHTVRRLEERLGIRLLTRTTRNVQPTDAGERLAETLRPAFGEIASRIESLTALRESPAGVIRVTSGRYAAETILLPAARRLMAEHRAVSVEISVDHRLVDLVTERYDAGVRLGESVEKDMVAVRVGPDLRMVVAGTPRYFQRHPPPVTPYDLTQHNCVNLRLSTLGGLYTWEFERDGRPVNVRVNGQFTCNDVSIIIDAGLCDVGLVCLPEDHLLPLVRAGKLQSVLDEWCPPFPGYHLYYPSRRLASPAFALFVEAVRYRPSGV